jgi:hypothetical protein
MRKRFICFTAVLFLVSSTELHELVRLPLLVSHFIHHRHSSQSLNLAGFIHLHYRVNHPADNDDGEDRQLPFKSLNDGLKAEFTNTIFPGALTENISIPVVQPAAYCPEGIPLHRAYGVFHPPRIATGITV